MMIIPISESGANTALLVPMTILASPRRILLNSSSRCPTDSPECITATVSPKYPENLATVWGVSEISGTSIKADFPRERTYSISLIKTAVFPLPVTPYNSAPAGLCASIRLLTPS